MALRALAVFASLSLGGCAPLASFRPASGLMRGKQLEVGAGVAIVAPRAFVDEQLRGAAQVWTSGEPSAALSLSAIGAFDSEAVAVGGALRLNFLNTDRTAAGVEAELGYAWAALSLPFAFRTLDETWLYSAPRIGTWGTEPLLSLPVGASVRVVGGFMLRPEAQVSFQALHAFNRRWQLGAAAAYQR